MWVGGGQGCIRREGPSEAVLEAPLDRPLEEVAKAVGGGYCRLQMPFSLALAVRETVAPRRLVALEGGLSHRGGYPPPPCNASLVGGSGGAQAAIPLPSNGLAVAWFADPTGGPSPRFGYATPPPPPLPALRAHLVTKGQ